ncbi:MAG: hypothetical protein K0B15_13330 [Lentimicrobium sp.]|nr:hypothetical protein [Lentimicrobium sp.]
MKMADRRKNRKIRKFKAVQFKLTVQQKKRVDAFCKKYNTTPVTMYKIAIQTFLSKNGYGTLPKHHDQGIPGNQMTIFDVVEDLK